MRALITLQGWWRTS
ncbi:trp operon leader peptide [Huaxiibacter chinensis]